MELYFNSRPHGGRRKRIPAVVIKKVISTHALTEGDDSPSISPAPLCHFNSRPHGGRQMRPSPSIIRYYFNSRPHGGRPPPLPFQRAIGHFNSRPHGGRRCPRTVQVGRFKFQLTPSRRATTRTILPATPRLHFNSRPHGGRPLLTIVFVCSGISTHALTEGDFILKYQDNIRFLFQLTPSRRATANLDKFFF